MRHTVKINRGRSVSIQGGSNTIVYEDVLVKDESHDSLFERLESKGMVFTNDDTFIIGNDGPRNWQEAFKKIKELFN